MGAVFAALLVVLLLILAAAQCSPDRPCDPTGPVPCHSIGGQR